MSKNIKILWTENAEWPQGWGIKAHYHEYYHLFYFLSGNSHFLINKKSYEAKRGACFLVPPHTVHELQKTVGDTVTSYEIKFMIYDKMAINNLENWGYSCIGDPYLEELVQFVVDNGLSRTEEFREAAEAALFALIIYLTREFYRSNDKFKNSQLIDTTGFSNVTVSVIIYIEKHFTQQINLNMIADSIGYNKNYICTLFKSDTGITIIDYLNFVRIRQAVVYFSYSDMEISLICARVGFANVSHFNRTFKKFTGISPTTFKKMYPLDFNTSLEGSDSPAAPLEKQIQAITRAFGIFSSFQGEKQDP